MKTDEYYVKVKIDSEDDLPRKNGVYFVKIKTPKNQLELTAVAYIWENDKYHVNGFWLNKVNWYLLPVEQIELPSDGEIKTELESYLQKLIEPLNDYQKFRLEVAFEYAAKWAVKWIKDRIK